MSLLIKPTRDDLRKFSTLAKACYKAGKNDAGHDWSVAATRSVFAIEEYETLYAAYHAWRNTGTLPN